MWFYVRLLAGGQQKMISVNVPHHDPVKSIFRVLAAKEPGLQFIRALFSGQALDENESLETYNIHKECTVQVMAKKATTIEELPSHGNPMMLRQITADAVAYGDVVIVKVLAAKDLMGVDYWSGKSDPYCILEHVDPKSQSKYAFRTSVISRNLNPAWGETFGFPVTSPDAMMPNQTLSVMVWDHDYLSPDEPLGVVDIDLSELPRYIPGQPQPEESKDAKPADATKWYPLQGAKSGEVQLMIRRAALSSPMLRDILHRLAKKGKKWTQSLLKKHNVSIRHFLGEVPFVLSAPRRNDNSPMPLSQDLHKNPALAHLEQLLRTGALRLRNARTVAKVANILWSQNAVHTQDLPCRHLWIIDMDIPGAKMFSLLQRLSKGQLKSLVLFKTMRSLCAVATLKSAEAAILALLALQYRVVDTEPDAPPLMDRTHSDTVMDPMDEDANAPLGGLDDLNIRVYDEDRDDKPPLAVGFGSSPVYDSEKLSFAHCFSDALLVDIFFVAGPYPTTDNFNHQVDLSGQGHQNSEWGKHMMVLHRDGLLEAYTKLQDFPHALWKISVTSKTCLVLPSGPWSLEVVDTDRRVSYYLRAHRSDMVKDWQAVIRTTRRNAKKSAGPAASSSNDQSGSVEVKELTPPTTSSSSAAQTAQSLEQKEDCRMCAQCKQQRHVSLVYVLDAQDGTESDLTCKVCYQNTLKQTFEDSISGDSTISAEELLKKFSLQDMQDLVSTELVQKFLDRCTTEFLAKHMDNKMSRCPSCDTVFEVAYHTWATKQPNMPTELGLDRQPLTADAQRHYLGNRFRCPNEKCNKTFCRKCNVVPYHRGFNCKEYETFLASPKCRFCGVAVMMRNKWRKSPGGALEYVCNNEECVEAAGKSCVKMLECGHPCGGIRDEQRHLPCLHPECIDKRRDEQKERLKGAPPNADSNGDLEAVIADALLPVENIVTQATKDDLCSICYVDELGERPAVLLDCGHVFHHHCLVTRLETKWTGFRINFKFCHCPLCNKWIKAPHLIKEMEDHVKLYEQVLSKIEERVEIDEDEDEDYQARVLQPGSDFYKKPLMWGMKSYAYYTCNSCGQPYFGGKRNCEDNAADDKTNKEELVCYDCATIMGSGDCGKPGHKEFLVYKCRFCCSESVWFCFGTTHFCEYCHSHWPPNRHPPNKDCPDADGKCPLGLKPGTHKNGPGQDCEFSLGCGMCRAALRKEAEEKREEEMERIRKKKEKKRLEKLVQQGVQALELSCPKKHILKMSEKLQYICDECNASQTDEHWRCAQCGYDLCPKCSKQIQEASKSLVPPDTAGADNAVSGVVPPAPPADDKPLKWALKVVPENLEVRWTCAVCSFENDSDKLECALCVTRRPEQLVKVVRPGGDAGGASAKVMGRKALLDDIRKASYGRLASRDGGPAPALVPFMGRQRSADVQQIQEYRAPLVFDEHDMPIAPPVPTVRSITAADDEKKQDISLVTAAATKTATDQGAQVIAVNDHEIMIAPAGLPVAVPAPTGLSIDDALVFDEHGNIVT